MAERRLPGRRVKPSHAATDVHLTALRHQLAVKLDTARDRVTHTQVHYEPPMLCDSYSPLAYAQYIIPNLVSHPSKETHTRTNRTAPNNTCTRHACTLRPRKEALHTHAVHDKTRGCTCLEVPCHRLFYVFQWCEFPRATVDKALLSMYNLAFCRGWRACVRQTLQQLMSRLRVVMGKAHFPGLADGEGRRDV